MKKWFFQIASLAVLLVLTATVALPCASARYVIYSCVIAPNLDTMTSGTLKKSVNGGTAETATASDFVMRDGDAGECSISLDFGGLIHSKANADACYASIGLVATPVE
jgi:hypothetical protein